MFVLNETLYSLYDGKSLLSALVFIYLSELEHQVEQLRKEKNAAVERAEKWFLKFNHLKRNQDSNVTRVTSKSPLKKVKTSPMKVVRPGASIFSPPNPISLLSDDELMEDLPEIELVLSPLKTHSGVTASSNLKPPQPKKLNWSKFAQRNGVSKTPKTLLGYFPTAT
jgi:hypothetical protein